MVTARRCGPGRLGSSVGWAVPAGFGALALLRLTAADRWPATDTPAASLLPFTPQFAAAAWLAAALQRDRRASAATAITAVALTAALAPRAIPRRQPVISGPVVRVLTANLLGGLAAPGAVVELVSRLKPDVFFVQELTPGALRRLGEAGLAESLPHVVTDLGAPQPRGNAIYAAHPLLEDPPLTPTSSVQPAATLRLPAGELRLISVHFHTPKRPWSASGAAAWRDDLRAVASLPVPVRADEVPLIVAGDFNATVDHGGFRDILEGGFADAACQRGNGLVPTWGPLPGGRGALLAIDHILVDRRCAVLSTSAHRLPGTDHRALFAAVRLPPARPALPRLPGPA